MASRKRIRLGQGTSVYFPKLAPMGFKSNVEYMVTVRYPYGRPEYSIRSESGKLTNLVEDLYNYGWRYRVIKSGTLKDILNPTKPVISVTIGIAGEPTKPAKPHEFPLMKFRVKDKKHSEHLQNHLFSLGCKWAYLGAKVSNLNAKFLFVDRDGTVTWSGNDNWYKEQTKYTEYELNLAYTLAPAPVVRKTVEVNGKKYYEEDIVAKCKAV